jgi:stage III sporulation protein AD
MEVVKAAVIGITAAMMALYMKSVKSEYSTIISIGAGILIFGYALICLEKIIGSIETLGSYLSISSVYIRILLRITGVAYICDFASCICKDAGYQAIASQIELLGRLSIVVMSLPVLQTLLTTINGFVGG